MIKNQLEPVTELIAACPGAAVTLQERNKEEHRAACSQAERPSEECHPESTEFYKVTRALQPEPHELSEGATGEGGLGFCPSTIREVASCSNSSRASRVGQEC